MGVHRRDMLVGLAAAAGLAGCAGAAGSGGRRPPTADRPAGSSLRIVDFDTTAAADGSLVVQVTVQNPTDARRTATVTAVVRAGARRETQSTSVTVDPHGRSTTALPFDMPAREFEADGELSLRLD